jgi:hypothetical protein
VSLHTRFWVAFPAWRHARKARRTFGPGNVQGINPI